jgi:hypothetical protein
MSTTGVELIQEPENKNAIPLARSDAGEVVLGFTPSVTHYEVRPDGKLPGITIRVSWTLRAGAYEVSKLQWSPANG